MTKKQVKVKGWAIVDRKKQIWTYRGQAAIKFDEQNAVHLVMEMLAMGYYSKVVPCEITLLPVNKKKK